MPGLAKTGMIRETCALTAKHVYPKPTHLKKQPVYTNVDDLDDINE